MKSPARSFISEYTTKPEFYHNTLRWIIRSTEKLNFNHAYNLFNRIENHYTIPEHGINVMPPKSLPMLSGILGGYMLEKAIVYAKGSNRIHIDTIRTSAPKGEISLVALYNQYNSLYRPHSASTISQLSTIMMPIMSEQLRIQKPLYPDLMRFYRCFGQDGAIADFFIKTFNIDIRKMYFLGFLLFAYIINEYSKNKDVIVFTAEAFTYFISSVTEISKEDVEIFLSNISLTREEYIEKYHAIRFNSDQKPYDYSHQERFDRALPKVSYSYPLLKKDDKYMLISLNSYYEFLKMDRFYRMITFDISKDFKSTHVGPAIEKYVESLAKAYASTIPDQHPNVYGNRGYKLKGKKDEPDVILETDDYVLYIECKANAFGLKLLKEFDTNSFQKTLTAVEISKVNIDRYQKVHEDRLKGKKVFKILVFYEGLDNWFELLNYDVNTEISENDIQLMGIGTLENLFLQKLETIDALLESLKLHKNENPYDTTMEMIMEPVLDAISPDEAFFEQLAKEFGLQLK